MEVDHYLEHGCQGIPARPRTEMVGVRVNVHLGSVDFHHQLAHLVDYARLQHVVNGRPFRELDIQLHVVYVFLKYRYCESRLI